MYSILISSLLAATVFAAPVRVEERAAVPSVTIQNGTVIGSSSSGVDSFKGIPFALPPTGSLRLKPPQTITSNFGTITATAVPTACPFLVMQVDTSNLVSDVIGELLDLPIVQEVAQEGENCLTLNVQRPSTATSSSKLPVVFWIFGGGFELGSTSMYDGTNIVTKSISLGADVVYVAVNYRVSGFGFLAGKELSEDGSTNLGLRDQRLGLQWVAENIEAFGGDPTKVTIWGESAGSISVFDQTIINGGDNTYNGQPLFRGAIMNSGSIVPADPVTAPQAQAVYDTVVENAGCSSSSDTLTCLRSVSYETFLQATQSVPGIFSYRSLDLSYLPRPDPADNFFSQSPELSVEAGSYAKVPIIIGDQEDEGTLFSLVLSNISTNAEVVDYLSTYFPSNPNAVADVTEVMSTYPDEPLLGQPAGSPFNTGPLNNIYPQFKRLAAVLGDLTFTLTRRGYLSEVASTVNAWSYLNTYLYGTPVLGTFHGADILVDYGTSILEDIDLDTTAVQQYYISFINDLNPNSLGTSSPNIEWPQWTNSSGSPQLVNFALTGLSLMTDDFRSESYDTLMSIGISNFRV